MPLVKDAPQRTTKSFKRKEYRPWDLFGENDNPTKTVPTNHLIIKDTETSGDLPLSLDEKTIINPGDPSKNISPTIDSSLPPVKSLPDPVSHTHIPNTVINLITEAVDAPNVISNSPLSEKVMVSKKKSGNKVVINKEESDNKVIINREESSNKVIIKEKESGNKLVSKLISEVIINREESGNKLVIKTSFSMLVGKERIVTLFVYECCKMSRSKVTDPLSIEHIAKSLKTTKGNVKSTINHLISKEIISRFCYKDGRGGWTQYELPDPIYNEIIQNETNKKLIINWEETDNKLVSKLISKPIISESSSSSLNNKETTTTSLSDEWNFDITPYARFGFTFSQVKQLVSLGVISAINVEQSLIEFSYDLDNNALPVIKTGKINFLMGLLRSGHSYVSEGFKSEQEAMISEMARRAEGKRKKRLEEKFSAWEEALSDAERKEVINKLPPPLMVLHRAHGISNPEIRNWLFNYYLQQALAK